MYLLAACTLGSVVTSCDDDDDVINSPVSSSTYEGEESLDLTYSGQPLLGKKVVFAPHGDKATLTLSGSSFSISSNITKDAQIPMDMAPATCGVIPGEQTTVLEVNLMIEGDKVSFEGQDTKNGRVINYNGKVSNNHMTLTLNVTMPENDLSGKTFNMDNKNPMIIKWTADKITFLGDPNYEFENLLKAVFGFPIIDGHAIAELLLNSLHSISFLPDGNIQAEYKGEGTNGEWGKSDLNLANYVVNDSIITLFLNPQQIKFVSDKNKEQTRGIETIIPQLLNSLSTLMIQGVPVTFKESEGKLAIYVTDEFLLPILKTVKPLFEDEAFKNTIKELITEKAGPIGTLVTPVVDEIPKVINTTKDINLGMNMVLAQ